MTDTSATSDSLLAGGSVDGKRASGQLRTVHVLVNNETVAEVILNDIDVLPYGKEGDLDAERERLYRALNQIAYWVSEGEYDDTLGPLAAGDQP